MKLKKGDQVEVLSGKDKGKRGTITRVYPEKNKVLVDGVNIVKKHQRARKANEQGGIIDKELPLSASAVAIVSPTDGKRTRIGYRFDDEGMKHRVCRRTGSDL